jgi:F-box-like
MDLTKRGCIRNGHIQALPEEVLPTVFCHLGFEDKCRCCLVCASWNRVLRRPLPELWREILIDLALVVKRTGVEADRWQDVCKWFAFRSGGIQKVKFRAIMTLEDDSKPIKELVQVLNEQFAFLAGALTWTRTPMYFDLSFKGTCFSTHLTKVILA